MQKENNKLNLIFIIVIIKALLNKLINKVFTAGARYGNTVKKINYFFAKIWFSLLLIFNTIFTKFLTLISVFFYKLSLPKTLTEKPILSLFKTVALNAKSAF